MITQAWVVECLVYTRAPKVLTDAAEIGRMLYHCGKYATGTTLTCVMEQHPADAARRSLNPPMLVTLRRP